MAENKIFSLVDTDGVVLNVISTPNGSLLVLIDDETLKATRFGLKPDQAIALSNYLNLGSFGL